MKQKLLALAAIAALAFTTTSHAAFYADTTGDEFTGNPHMDITSCEVTNDFANLIFKINLAGDPVAVNWGKYCLGIDTNATTGDFGPNGNGWGRKISMTAGMDYWIGTWVDGGMGAGLSAYDGAFWTGIGGATVSKTTSNVTITMPISALNKTYGDSFDFDIYTTGGGTDPAIDALANPAQTVGNWGDFYSSALVKTYTLVTPPIPSTNRVKFMVNMEIPIWEFDNAIGNGFNTNADTLYVRGSFNGWGTVSAGYNLIQVGPTLFSNTVDVIDYLGSTVNYKFEGAPFPGYETPVLACGGNRTLTITNLNMSAPLAYWSDRKLSDPTASITFEVDMSVVRNFGQFDPNAAHTVTMPGAFNGWNNSALTLAAGSGANTNIYSTTLTYVHYPTNGCNISDYKFFIAGNGAAHDGGWELPISHSGGNRSFGIGSLAQTNRYYYNDENPNFNVTSIQKLDADSAKITWQSFPARGAITTGGQYAIESLDTLTGTWSTNGTVGSTTSSSSFTNTGVTPVSTRFYRVGLIGL